MSILAYELGTAGVGHTPPHFCTMYLRPMLGLGERCRLDAACACHGIELEAAQYHSAAADTIATAELLELCLGRMGEKGVRTFGDLAEMPRSYKFLESFARDPLPGAAAVRLAASGRSQPRRSPMYRRSPHRVRPAAAQQRRLLRVPWPR